MRISLFLGFWLLLAKASLAQTAGINLGGYEYPFPVRYHTVSEEVKMAYLVVDPETAANGRFATRQEFQRVLLGRDRRWLGSRARLSGLQNRRSQARVLSRLPASRPVTAGLFRTPMFDSSGVR